METFPYEMTDEIAFELGTLKYGRFYDYAIWTPNVEEFELANFFHWGLGMGLVSHLSSKRPVQLSGSLNESKFTTLEHKLAYLRGRLMAYSVTIGETTIEICYANSFASRDRWVKWCHEVLAAQYAGVKTWKITKGEGMIGIPATPDLKLEADAEIIRFLTSDEKLGA